MKLHSRIYVAGGTTLLGHALRQHLHTEGFTHLVGTPPDEPDLTHAGQVEDFFAETRPEYVFVVAGKSGGIALNRARPAELMLDNLLAVAHLLQAAHSHGVKKLLYLASSCSYPRAAAQPLRVESLLTGPLEPTNAAYAMAKLAGWQLCTAFRQQEGAPFITAIPANAFGPHDDFSPEGGHIIPALLGRAHAAQARGDAELSVWGTGTPRREFIYAADVAAACLFVMQHYDGNDPINLGSGVDLSVAEVAQAVVDVVGYQGRLCFDTSKPDGMPLKRLDSTPLLQLGWQPRHSFQTALTATYDWYLHHVVKEDREDVPIAVSIPLSDSSSRTGGSARLPR